MKKIMIFASEEEYENYIGKNNENGYDFLENRVCVVNSYRIINGKKFEGIGADATITCKKAETAIKRFCKEMQSNGYNIDQECLESCTNGENLHALEECGMVIEVEDLGNGIFYINFMCFQDEESDSKADATSSSSDETEKTVINSASTLGFYSENGVVVKGFADRIEVDLNVYAIHKISSHMFSHDLGYIRYRGKKWSFSSDEKNLTVELLHKLIELYDDGITPDEIWLKGKSFTPIDFIDYLYMKDAYFILSHWHTYEKGFFQIYHGYASKRLLIDTNKSNVFNKWKNIVPVSKFSFLEAIKWICADTASEEKCYTRAIALTPDGIVKLAVSNSVSGYKYFDENGKNFLGAYFKRKAVTDHEKLFADENGDLSSFAKIILSPKDRI